MINGHGKSNVIAKKNKYRGFTVSKKCFICGKEHSLNKAYCKECNKKKCREYYKNNREAVLEANKKWNKSHTFAFRGGFSRNIEEEKTDLDLAGGVGFQYGRYMGDVGVGFSPNSKDIRIAFSFGVFSSGLFR